MGNTRKWVTAALTSAATIATTFVVLKYPTMVAATIMSIVTISFGLLHEFVKAREDKKERRNDLK